MSGGIGLGSGLAWWAVGLVGGFKIHRRLFFGAGCFRIG